MEPRDRSEQGATLVEASLMLPMMILIMIGLLETGLAFKDYLTVSFAAREGARVGALAGNNPDADCEIVHAVIDALGVSGLGDFEGIEIYQADPATGNPVAGKTNTWEYTGTDPYDCVNDWTVTENWVATNRNVAYGPTSPLDIIGVRVQVTHDWITGMPPFSGDFIVDEATISRLEPESFE